MQAVCVRGMVNRHNVLIKLITCEKLDFVYMKLNMQ